MVGPSGLLSCGFRELLPRKNITRVLHRPKMIKQMELLSHIEKNGMVPYLQNYTWLCVENLVFRVLCTAVCFAFFAVKTERHFPRELPSLP